MEKQKAIEKLKCQLKKVNELRQRRYDCQEFKEWRRDTVVALKKIFKGDNGSHAEEFEKISYSPMMFTLGGDDTPFYRAHASGLDSAEAKLKSMIKELEEWGIDENSQPSFNAIAIIENLCERFHLVVRKLKARHDNRETLAVKDEYDVQDLLHSLLTLHFDDIRPEEWAPSYAGGCSRMDFLLKQEQIVIEVKKTRERLGAKQVGEQLIVDIQKYKQHPDCSMLFCFVYDPEARIANPRGIENDLSKTYDELSVKVLIKPM